MRLLSRGLSAATAVAAVGVLAGCGLTMQDLPLPGTGVSGDRIEVRADFRDALNLAQGAPVKVNGISAGEVTSIGEKDFTAVITMDVRTSAALHQGATARLRYTTPLGELFVDVTNPNAGPLLTDGSVLGLRSTDTAPSVEDALSSASLLINGGGLDQLQTITDELNRALTGHEGAYKALIERSRTFLTQANATTGSIDRVLTSLNAVSRTLNAREGTIDAAMKQLRPAASVLREETPAFVRLLTSIRQFSAAANGTVDATRAQLLRMLQQVRPVLVTFNQNRGRFETSLEGVMGASRTIDKIISNDYGDISVKLELDKTDLGGRSTNTGNLLPGVKDLLQVIGLGGLLKQPQ